MRKLLFLCAALLSSATLLFADINYLTFTAEEDNSSVQFKVLSGTAQTINLLYSKNGEEFVSYALGTVIQLANIGDNVRFYGNNKAFAAMSGSSVQYAHGFAFTGKIAASGSVMSIILDNGSVRTAVPNYAFYKLFAGGNSKDKDCLTQAPELPATEVGNRSYASMFASCKALKKAPELPATTLGDFCYQNMFEYCSALEEGPSILPTTVWGPYTSAEHSGCYQSMFSSCTTLVKAPKLPATTLTANKNQYQSMFNGCSALSYIDMDAPGSLNGNNSQNWVQGVAAKGYFVCPKPVTSLSSGVNACPTGWTVAYKYTITDSEFPSDIAANKTYHITVTGRTISAGQYNTICLPFALESLEGTPFENAKVVEFKGATMEGDEMVLDFDYVEAIEAGKPYLIKPEEDLVSPIEFGVVTTMSSKLNPITIESDNVDFVGVIKPASLTASTSTLVLSENNNLYYVDKKLTMPSLRAYFNVKVNPASAPRFASIRIGNPAPTSLNSLKKQGPAAKVMENGRFVIVRNGEKYNVMGQQEK